MLEFITQELEALKEAGLYRELKTIEKIEGGHVTLAGKKYLNFCSNDYLGLSEHPKVKEQASLALKEFGAGSRASPLICGNTILHEKLEHAIARFKGREAAIVFPSGYMANLGAITALTDENDTIIIDRLNHASIIDACRMSRAKLQVYPHRDMQKLEKILQRSNKYKKRLIATDSIFSMDGDIAPLPDIVKLAQEYHAITMIDEAHATGTIGYRGRGAEELFEMTGQIDIIMGTLSKALGSQGGFIAGSLRLIEYLRNKSRSFIYSTALSPACCAAATAAIEIIEEEPQLRGKLKQNITHLTPLIPLSIINGEGENRYRREEVRRETPIIPIMIGDAKKTMDISRKLFDRGIFITGIRPPTVPKGESRLRITVTEKHTKEEVACLASLLQELIPE